MSLISGTLIPLFGYVSFWLFAILATLALGQFIWLLVKPLKPVDGKHVLITGGSMGIGFEVAKVLAAEGAKITIWARKIPELEAATKALKTIAKVAEDVTYQSVDVTNAEAVKCSFLDWVEFF
jgi:5,10-methylene-tetrahydrofolate dehydrogenase/methenyl tetrahydrofolate cyclohydrolase